MKKTIAFLLSLVMALSLLTACSTQKEPNSPNKGGNTSDPSNLKIGLVLTGSANDGGWNQMAADAASTVAAKYGCTVNFSESVATTDIENTIRGYADAGYDIVFAHGAELFDASKQVSKDYPDTKFINSCAFSGQEPNLTGVDFGAYELGFLNGLACAYATEAKKVGVIIAVESDSMLTWVEGIKDAVKYADESIEVVVVATGSFDDPIKAKQATDAMASKGCDVITQNADACGNGAVEECDALGLVNVGAVGDQSAYGESCFLSVIQDAHQGIAAAIDEAINGTLKPGPVVMGANANVVYLTGYTGKYANLLTDEEKATLQSVWQQAHDGIDLHTLTK